LLRDDADGSLEDVALARTAEHSSRPVTWTAVTL
jgi:hypothetical protein